VWAYFLQYGSDARAPRRTDPRRKTAYHLTYRRTCRREARDEQDAGRPPLRVAPGMAPARGVAAIIRLAVAPPGFVASNRTLLSRGKNARQPNLKVLYSPRRWDNEAAAHSEAPGARRQTKPSLLRCVPQGRGGEEICGRRASAATSRGKSSNNRKSLPA
jgi:hypothetical protein